jgi:hypothetical protein
MTGLGNVASSIFGAFPSAGEILSSIGHIDLSSLMHGSFTLPGGHKISWATGGIAVGPVTRLIGEAGPEAVVPLTGPLSRVDPAVRELSAFARGQITTASATGRGGRSVTTGPITIITPTRDPVAVAQQVINRVAAASYI